MLEDDFTWVVRKAFKGLALSPGEAAVRAGLGEREVLEFSRGKFDAELARGLAPILGLDAGALVRHPHYAPLPLEDRAITRLDMPFGGDAQVNAWLVRSGGVQILFDTGVSGGACMDALCGLLPDAAFITHGHPDHTGGIPALLARGIACFGPGCDLPVHAGQIVNLGGATVEVVDLSGHAKPSFGYLVSGLAVPTLVVGDAVFAGSIGGCPDPTAYREALERIARVLAPLPPQTVILPGHGPATTLGEERAGNPFLAAM
jgi:hydroxyacylglutathione hydrolase